MYFFSITLIYYDLISCKTMHFFKIKAKLLKFMALISCQCPYEDECHKLQILIVPPKYKKNYKRRGRGGERRMR